MGSSEEADDHRLRTIGRCFEIEDVPEGAETGRHFYIEQLENGSVALELVDADGSPTGQIVEEGIHLSRFASRYRSCSKHDCPIQPKTVEEVLKRMSQVRSEMGMAHLEAKELEEAEDKFRRSLRLDGDNLLGLLGLGMTHMEQELVDEAMAIFKKIRDANDIYEQKNKHTFNEFAIYLRKKGLYDEAIANYEKAIVIDDHDEILYYNLGRAHWEKGELRQAIDTIKEGMRLGQEKKLQSLDALRSNVDDERLNEDHEYLHLAYQKASDQLERYLDREKEMLEELFSHDPAPRPPKPAAPPAQPTPPSEPVKPKNEPPPLDEPRHIDVTQSRRSADRLYNLLSQLGEGVPEEQTKAAYDQLEHIRVELKEEAPSANRIGQWGNRLMEQIAALPLTDGEMATVREAMTQFTLGIDRDLGHG